MRGRGSIHDVKRGWTDQWSTRLGLAPLTSTTAGAMLPWQTAARHCWQSPGSPALSSAWGPLAVVQSEPCWVVLVACDGAESRRRSFFLHDEHPNNSCLASNPDPRPLRADSAMQPIPHRIEPVSREPGTDRGSRKEPEKTASQGSPNHTQQGRDGPRGVPTQIGTAGTCQRC